jgi:hypothetical protein
MARALDDLSDVTSGQYSSLVYIVSFQQQYHRIALIPFILNYRDRA